MAKWMPVKKVMAAGIAALAGNGGALALYLSGEIDGRTALAVGLAALVPVVTGYLVPEGSPLLRGGFIVDPDPGEEGEA